MHVQAERLTLSQVAPTTLAFFRGSETVQQWINDTISCEVGNGRLESVTSAATVMSSRLTFSIHQRTHHSSWTEQVDHHFPIHCKPYKPTTTTTTTTASTFDGQCSISIMNTWFAFLMAFLSSVVPDPSRANNYHVIFFRDSGLQGPYYFEVTFGALRRCYNIDKCFNDAASSVFWAGIPEYTLSSPTYIRFFTDVNCNGKSKAWQVDMYNYPRDLTPYGLNDQISSFVIEAPNWDEYYNIQCGRRRRSLETANGSRSDGNSSSIIVADCSEDDEDGVFYLNETSSDAPGNTSLVAETFTSDLDGR